MTRRVTDGDSSASPAATVRTADYQLLGRIVLQNEPAGPRPQRAEDVLIQIERREDEHPAVGSAARIRRVASSPSSSGIRMSIRVTSGWTRAACADRLEPVAGLRDDFEVRLVGEQHPETRPHHRLIVDEHGADGHAWSAPSSGSEARST